MEHEELHEEGEARAKRLDQRTDELGEDVSRARSDWESKKGDQQVPGAQDEPDPQALAQAEDEEPEREEEAPEPEPEREGEPEREEQDSEPAAEADADEGDQS
jgi:hypothetical protein